MYCFSIVILLLSIACYLLKEGPNVLLTHPITNLHILLIKVPDIPSKGGGGVAVSLYGGGGAGL